MESFWGIATEWHRVFVLQKAAVRVLASLGYRESCRGKFRELSLLTLPAIYVQESVLFAHKHIRDFDTLKHSYNTRHKENLVPNLHSTSLYQRGAYYNACKYFNCVPRDLRDIKNLVLFKSKLKHHLLHLEPYDVRDFDI